MAERLQLFPCLERTIAAWTGDTVIQKPTRSERVYLEHQPTLRTGWLFLGEGHVGAVGREHEVLFTRDDGERRLKVLRFTNFPKQFRPQGLLLGPSFHPRRTNWAHKKQQMARVPRRRCAFAPQKRTRSCHVPGP